MTLWTQIYFIIEGAAITLKYSITAVLLGLIIATLLAILKISKRSYLRLLANIYTSIFRGTPLLIQLTMIYFLLPAVIGIKLSVFAAGIISFSLNSGAYISEVIRAGINAVDKGQFEAAKVLGISQGMMMKDIILPQAIKTIFPALINELINMVKESALISIVGEMDLMRRAQMISAQTYDYFVPMLTASITYYILIMIISTVGKFTEKRFSK